MKVVLIGFMGSGKSKLGKKMARLLNLPFIDLDNFIEQKYKLSISEIFQEKGEEYFRQIESDTLKEIVHAEENFVLASGGGTPCFNDNMEFINSISTSIYLNVSEKILFGRLRANKSKRPLIANLSDDELKAFIEKKLSERNKFYSQAQHLISVDNLTAKKIVALLYEEF